MKKRNNFEIVIENENKHNKKWEFSYVGEISDCILRIIENLKQDEKVERLLEITHKNSNITCVYPQ